MQQTNAAIKCNKPNGPLYYHILTFAWARASYIHTCSDTKPVAPRLRETGTPRNPSQRSRRSLREYGTT